MDRRNFLQAMAAATAGLEALQASIATAEQSPEHPKNLKRKTSTAPSTEGYTFVSEFKRGKEDWKVYEDLRTRDGSIVFVSSSGDSRELPKSAEASIAEGTPYFGLTLKEVSLAPADLLTDRLLKDGARAPEALRSVAPPMASAEKNPRTWTTFVGTKEAYDVTSVYRSGRTRTYHPIQYAPELHEVLNKGQLYDGLVGGWMPAIRKVIPIGDHAYWEVMVFCDVGVNRNKYIVHTWHRTARIEDGKVAKVVYGHSYPAYPPARQDPQPEEFYRALLDFSEYWERQLHDFAPAELAENVWIDLSKHSFAKELMTRPGGIYPKYGAVDRDYAGSEYDGFQDVFTS